MIKCLAVKYKCIIFISNLKTNKMNFITFGNIDTNHTHLQGVIPNCSYERLIKTFGYHHGRNDGYKTDVEWEMKFDDGTVATIYNWKNGKNYKRFEPKSAGLEKENITVWHVGGHTKKAFELVMKTIKEKNEKCLAV